MKNKIKHIAGALLIIMGMLAELGAIGTMDYRSEVGEPCSLIPIVIQGAVGTMMTVIGGVMCRDIEFEEDDYEQE